MPRERGDDHADEPQPELGSHQAEAFQRAAGEMRPQIIGDREIHDHDGAAEDQVEMPGDPLRVVDAGIELIAHVDQPAGAAEAEHDQRQRGRQHDRILPGQRADPSERALAAAQAAGDFGRCADREHRQQRRQRDQPGEHRMHELESGADLRIGKQMMHADRHRHHDEQDEGNPRHRVAVEPAADRAREDRVIGDIGRDQPEIDDRMQRPGEEHARQPGVDGRPQAERHRQDLENDFERGADRGPAPEIGARDIGEHRQRHRLVRDSRASRSP